MYDINLTRGEEIILICDDALIKDKLYSAIITTKKLYILDYPSKLYNSTEDLRASGRLNLVKKKEVIFSSYIKDIKDISKNQITFKDESSLLIECPPIINELKKITKEISYDIIN